MRYVLFHFIICLFITRSYTCYITDKLDINNFNLYLFVMCACRDTDGSLHLTIPLISIFISIKGFFFNSIVTYRDDIMSMTLLPSPLPDMLYNTIL